MRAPTLRILVGTDFSRSALLALTEAVELAKQLPARLHLCHVLFGHGPSVGIPLLPELLDELPAAKEARTRMQALLDSFGARVSGDVSVGLGAPAEGLLHFIFELRPNLVVVASHGKGMRKRALLGSVSDELLHRSPIPVLVVPTLEHTSRRNNNLLYAQPLHE